MMVLFLFMFLIFIFLRDYNLSYKRLLWQQLELFKTLPREISLKNLVLSNQNPEDVFVNHFHFINESPSQLYNLNLKPLTAYYFQNLPSIKVTFLPSTIIEWNKLDSNIHTSSSHTISMDLMIEFIRLHPNSIFNVPNFLGLTFLVRL